VWAFHLAGMNDSKGCGAHGQVALFAIRDTFIASKQPMSRPANKPGLRRTMLPFTRPFPWWANRSQQQASNIVARVHFIRAHRTNIGDGLGKRYYDMPSLSILLPLLFLGAALQKDAVRI